MKIPPKKPHFFKPLQPGFKNGLKIPIGFLKYLKGNDQIEHAILRRDGNKWPLKVNGHRFEAGWAEFVQQYDLQLGDTLMFRHEGNMEFEVSIFDSTHYDREYAEYMQEGGGGGGGAHTDDATERPMMRMIKSSKKASSHVKVARHHKSFGHFECIIREYSIRRGNWISSSITQTYIIGCGWTKFFADNCLRKGDRIMFEVVNNGETPIWKFQVTNREAPLLKFQGMFILIEPFSYFFDDLFHCHISVLFCCVYIISIRLGLPFICYLKCCLPLDFAKSNGLMNKNCEMVLKNEAQRCWSVWLGRAGRYFGIIRGWTKFSAENGLRVGDAYKFELIKNGEIPTAQFHCKRPFSSNVLLSSLKSMLRQIVF
ncbi:hypothetical protein H5410_057535 [Solanum commersonii]|uniref:TF-B3 domain-containing protein n=1 Tax=Solanum commersonii TaxID=4109 RepID=A0A9J5WNC3_SOLCO|nr:hypothetical protein H5410_057535 [Solanum commersonii]